MNIDRAIETSYRIVPFHDWNHGRDVHTALRKILRNDMQSYHHLGTKLHDAGHGYIAQSDDEKNAITLSRTLLEKLGFPTYTINKVGFLIDATIFRERGNLSNYDQMTIADADISSVGGEYDVFLKNSAKLYIESLPVSDYPSKQGILKFFKEQTLLGFMGFLTNITGDTDNPFLISENKRIFPHFVKNRDTLGDDLENNQRKLIAVVKAEWKNFYGKELILLEDLNCK